MKRALLFALLISGQTAFALLPPFAQSCQEIETILKAPETANLLGEADPIEQIVSTENGYLIVTKKQELLVDVQYIKSGKIGPQQFKLKFHTPVEIE